MNSRVRWNSSQSREGTSLPSALAPGESEWRCVLGLIAFVNTAHGSGSGRRAVWCDRPGRLSNVWGKRKTLPRRDVIDAAPAGNEEKLELPGIDTRTLKGALWIGMGVGWCCGSVEQVIPGNWEMFRRKWD